jgi:hypothetical protein
MWRTSVVGGAALLIVLTAACSGQGADPSPSPSPSEATAELTAWERVLEGIADDGTVDEQTALAAWSLAIGPLPGVKVPAGDPGPMPDGSGAVAWVLRRFDELSQSQQAAVGEALGGEVASGGEALRQSLNGPGFSDDVALAASSSQALGCYGQVLATADSPESVKYRDLVDEMVGELGARLGGAITMDLQTFVVLEQRAAAGDKSDAFTWADPGDCAQNKAKTCTIHFNPAAANEPEQELRAVVAHEVMHCYMFAHLGVRAYNLPPWIGEGIPAWVGETVAGGSSVSARWWRRYLTDPGKALFGRVYDAIGFYAHLDESGSDPWKLIVPMLDAFDNEPAWDASVGSGNAAFLDSWPTGLAREPDRGTAWDTRMAGITLDRPQLQKRAIGNGQSLTESAPPGGNRLVGTGDQRRRASGRIG